ncbi:MAG: cation:proton antiporter [Acidimicrobiia bacterium]|nr:cation:proton antiporter [Acidimicrobiia bacterium]
MFFAVTSFNAPLSEHEVLVFLVQLALLVGLARLLGGIVKAIGQPAVIGELLAGVLLGPSVFGKIAPSAHEWVFGEEVVQSVIFAIAWLGVIFLLIVIGYETDLGIIARFRRAALAVSAGALLVPLLAATVAGFLVPSSFVGIGVDRGVFVGFFALALAVSALPVVAKILQDLGFLRRNFGQITLAAGMTMDAVGWLLLAALSGIAQDGFDLALLGWSFGGLALFVVFVITAGRWFLDGIMRWVLDRGSNLTAALTVTVVAALTGAIVTQALRLEAILGAFLVGILLSTLRHQIPQVEHHLEVMTASVFAPIFFAFSGLRVDIGLLNSVEAVVWTVGLIVMAIVAKVSGTFVGGILGGIRGREALALGSGLSALGAMGIVVAIVGLNLGVVSETGYTVLVLAAIVTSLVAPQLLKAVVKGWEIPPEELQRIEREALLEASEILGSQRILLPTRGGRNSQYAARVITHVFDDPDVTVLAVDVVKSWTQRVLHRVRPGESDPDDVLGELAGVSHRMVRKTARDPAAAIAREARLGYDLVLLGATEEERDGIGVFSTVVDRVLGSIDIPSVIVRLPAAAEGDGMREMPRRILVPVVASRATRAAEELAYSLLKETGGRAFALHVVNRPEGQGIALDEAAAEAAVRAGQEMVSAAAAFGERLGVVVESGIRVAPNPAAEIVEVANAGAFDLVVIGAANKPLSNRPFFGHRVTYMIDHSEIPLAVVALPTRG